MDSDKILSYCDQIDALTQSIRDEVDGPVDPVHGDNSLRPAVHRRDSHVVVVLAHASVLRRALRRCSIA